MKPLSKLPASLSRPAGTAAILNRSDFNWDYAIGGLGFLSAANNEYRVERETAPYRKQQFDASAEPGEQSLDAWWYRSQSSYHGGAGQLFGDPQSDSDVSATRFYASKGVDPWELGKVQLLNRVDTSSSVTNVIGLVGWTPADDVSAAFGVADGTAYYTWRETGRTDYVWSAGANVLQSVTTDGTKVYVASADGVYEAPYPSTWDGAFTWTKIWDTGADPIVIGWVKQRLILCHGNDVYELTGSGPTLPTERYSHPNTSWRWTSVAEAGNAIYVAGYAGPNSAIYKFTLDTAGAMPTLTSGIIAAQMPVGEQVHSIYAYVGSHLAIGTNKGVRLAAVSDDGDLAYGPLIFETSQPVRDFTGRDRFIWATVSAGIDGDSGLYRIDLGNELEPLRFAYATDLAPSSTDASDCLAVAHFGKGDGILFTTANADYRERHSGVKVASGYLQTSRVRYNTTEPKLFKFLRVRGDTLAGSLSITTIDQNGTSLPLHTIGSGTRPSDDISILSPAAPQEHLSIKFTLNAATGVDPTTGAEFRSWQFKALPGAPVQRLITVPLLVFNSERDGRRTRNHKAIHRIQALEDIERDRDTVLFQDYACGENTLVVIERMHFTQTAPPSDRDCKGWGGVLTVTLRTVL